MLNRALRSPLEEHERAEPDRLLTILPQQMNVDGKAEDGETAQKPGSQKAQSASPLADGEVVAQTLIEGLGGVHENVFESCARRFFRERFEMGVHLGSIIVAGVFG